MVDFENCPKSNFRTKRRKKSFSRKNVPGVELPDSPGDIRSNHSFGVCTYLVQSWHVHTVNREKYVHGMYIDGMYISRFSFCRETHRSTKDSHSETPAGPSFSRAASMTRASTV